MNDLWKRALRHPLDYSGVLHRHTITFKHSVDEGNGCVSFIFERPENLRWRAGQHGVFHLPTKGVEGKQWRAFSVASSSYENEIRITTLFPPEPSDFKKKLATLQPGQVATIHGPFGEFHPKPGTTMVGIAGGVGITPFRSIAYEIANNYLKNVALTLIYAGKNDFFAFKHDFDVFVNHPNINVIYVQSPDEVNREIELATNHLKNKATYFISGSPGMIESVRQTLRTHGVKRIVNDPFKGY